MANKKSKIIKSFTEKTISISKNGKWKQVVRHTVVKGVKNRKGEPCVFSQTLHLKNKSDDK